MQHQVFDDNTAAKQRMAQAEYYRDGAKRWLDVIGVILLSPLVLPLVAGLWVLVRLDGGAGLFGHLRVGKDGSQFRCWKIRTMVPDAGGFCRKVFSGLNRATFRKFMQPSLQTV